MASSVAAIPGEDDIPNFILLPRAADELDNSVRFIRWYGRCAVVGCLAGYGR